MSARRPLILDKDTDDHMTRLLKDKLRHHIDDFLDLAETQPKLIDEWKICPTTDGHGQWQGHEDCAEAERIRVAAYSHFLGRHPNATAKEASQAYASYASLVRGHWVDGWD